MSREPMDDVEVARKDMKYCYRLTTWDRKVSLQFAVDQLDRYGTGSEMVPNKDGDYAVFIEPLDLMKDYAWNKERTKNVNSY